MTILFANNATSTLAGAISNTATSINLATGTGALFPSPTGGQFFMATLVDAATGLVREIVQVVARTGDTVTVVRAQEGTSAQNWIAGDLFSNLLTAGSLTQFVQSVVTSLGYTPLNKAGDSMGGKLNLNPSGTGAAGLNLGNGATPTSPSVADIWMGAGVPYLQDTVGTKEIALGEFVLASAYSYAVDAGTANAYSITTRDNHGGTALTEGVLVWIRIAHTNTGASTLSVNGSSANPIKKHSSGSLVDPAAGDLAAGHIYGFIWDNNAIWQMIGTVG